MAFVLSVTRVVGFVCDERVGRRGSSRKDAKTQRGPGPIRPQRREVPSFFASSCDSCGRSTPPLRLGGFIILGRLTDRQGTQRRQEGRLPASVNPWRSPRNVMLNVLSGTDPNGTWTLFLADLSVGGARRWVGVAGVGGAEGFSPGSRMPTVLLGCLSRRFERASICL